MRLSSGVEIVKIAYVITADKYVSLGTYYSDHILMLSDVSYALIPLQNVHSIQFQTRQAS